MPFVGFLYAGLMITPAGIKVLEFNVRLGDPETQVILRELKAIFYRCWHVLASGTEQREEIQWSSDCAVCLVCASSGYPEKPIVGDVIQGLEVVRDIEDVLIFQAGTTYSGSNIVTNGGRVLNITATAPTFREVCDKVYKAAGMVNFSGMHFRKDIGLG